MCNKCTVILTESRPEKNDLAERNYKTDSFRDRRWHFILFSQRIFQILLLKKLFFFFWSGCSSATVRTKGIPSKGFKPYPAFYHKVHDHLLHNNLHASSHKLDRFTCCAQGKQYKFNQILIFDLVKPTHPSTSPPPCHPMSFICVFSLISTKTLWHFTHMTYKC